jgi:co-chaperonin GroES (HSP10)
MENKTGIRPIEYKVLVLPDQVSEKTGGGLIVKADQTIYEETRGQVIGTLVAKSDMAFSDGEGKNWLCDIPQPGQKIMFAKYSGLMTDRIDGLHYRLMNDKDVVAIIDEVDA